MALKSIEAYMEELRRFQAAATSAPTEAATTAVDPPAEPSEPTAAPDEPTAEAVIAVEETEPMSTQAAGCIPAAEFRREYWNPTEAETGTGFLQIRVSSGREALPIADARVIVSRPEDQNNPNQLVLTTDSDGMTTYIALPTVDRSLSQAPGVPLPFSAYSIRTEAPDQLTVVNLHVPIFDGVSSIQRVNMVAPEGQYAGDGVIIFDEQTAMRLRED